MWQWLQQTWNYLQNIDINQVELWMQHYSNLGILPGLTLPLLESFIPFLPLFVFVMGNTAVYGLGIGFFVSWIGVCSGSIVVFILSRKFGKRAANKVQKKLPGTHSFFQWIEKKGFTPIFLLYCFPFTPSFLINVAAGIGSVTINTFIIALLSGKAVMIFIIALIGYDWQAFVYQPWRIAVTVVVLAILWLLGKQIEKYYKRQKIE